MREILKITARNKEEAFDAIEKALVALYETVGDDDIDIELVVKDPDDGGFTILLDPNELK